MDSITSPAQVVDSIFGEPWATDFTNTPFQRQRCRPNGHDTLVYRPKPDDASLWLHEIRQNSEVWQLAQENFSILFEVCRKAACKRDPWTRHLVLLLEDILGSSRNIPPTPLPVVGNRANRPSNPQPQFSYEREDLEETQKLPARYTSSSDCCRRRVGRGPSTRANTHESTASVRELDLSTSRWPTFKPSTDDGSRSLLSISSTRKLALEPDDISTPSLSAMEAFRADLEHLLSQCSSPWYDPELVADDNSDVSQIDIGPAALDNIPRLTSVQQLIADNENDCGTSSKSLSRNDMTVNSQIPRDASASFHSQRLPATATLVKRTTNSAAWHHLACHTLLPSPRIDPANIYTYLEQDSSSLNTSLSPTLVSSTSSDLSLVRHSPKLLPCSETLAAEDTVAATYLAFPELVKRQISSREQKWTAKHQKMDADPFLLTEQSESDFSSSVHRRQARPRRDDIDQTFREWHLSGIDTESEPIAVENSSGISCVYPPDLPARSTSSDDQQLTQNVSDRKQNMETPVEMNFIDKFTTSRGNEYFCDVDEEYLTDRFNLTGLNTEVQYYQYALDLVTDMFDLECEDDMREQIEKSARHLYGLVHARYIVTTRGLSKMMDKYKKGDFGKCPRVACESQHLLPMGQNDVANVSAVKLYCVKCEDLYNPKSQRHAAIDGAYFGTSFHNILFQVYPTLLPTKSQRRYEPRVFGFRVHAYAALARWQGEQKDKMKKRLQDLDVEVGFSEDEDPESEGIDSQADDKDALDDMFEGNRRAANN